MGHGVEGHQPFLHQAGPVAARRMERAAQHNGQPSSRQDSRWWGASSRHPERAQRRAPSCGHPEERPTQESSGWALAPKGPGAPAPTTCATTPVGSTSECIHREPAPAGAVRERSSRSGPISQPAPASGPKRKVAGPRRSRSWGSPFGPKGEPREPRGGAWCPRKVVTYEPTHVGTPFTSPAK